MKKALNTMLIVIAILLAFVACSPQEAVSDELVSATLVSTDRSTRSLDAEVDFDLSAVKLWKYTARKADSGLTTGETELDENKAATLNNDGTTAGLSQGAWNFVLYGYDAAENGNLIAHGSINNATVTTSSHDVTITVKPVQTAGAKGKIVISDDISIKSTDGTKTFTSGSEYKMSYVVYKTSDTKKTALTNLESVDVGSYTVVVTFKGTVNGVSYTAATETKTINVYAGLTTTVKGTIGETEQAANIKKEGAFVDIESTAVTGETISSALTLTANASPVGTDKTTSVSFPENSLNLSDGSTELKLTLIATPPETAATTYTITSDDEAVAGFDVTLEGATIAENNEGITFKSTIASGLDQAKLKIKYVKDANDESASITSYNSTSGEIEFKVKHFSEYVITTTENVVYDDASFRNAITAASESETTEIKLVKDITLSTDSVEIKKNLTFDLNKHTITFTQKDKGRVFGLLASDTEYTVTFKNGNIKGNGLTSSGSNLFIVDTNSKLVLDTVTVDAAIHTCVFLYIGANPSTLELKNSTLTINGAYGVSTNAGDASAKTNVTVSNSKINVTRSDDKNAEDCTGMIVNVNAIVSINDSEISGQRQGMILRGTGSDEVSIKNTKISSTGTKTTYGDRSTYWDAGNEVELAALVIGNRMAQNSKTKAESDGYKRPTKVKLENVTLSPTSKTNNRISIYVSQTTTANCGVTVSGTIKGSYEINDTSSQGGASVTLTTAEE